VPNPLADDLDHILAHTEGLWDELRGQRIFITGGTGFFGCWLLESFAWAHDRLGLGAEAVVLTRNPEAFAKKAPHLASHPAIRLHVGNVCTFEFPTGRFSHVIHAATATEELNARDPLAVFDINVSGTRRALEFSRHCQARGFLLTSSGAVYGRQPPEMERMPEDYLGAPVPVDTESPYGARGEEKRTAETLCALYAKQYGIPARIARCFSLVGPYMPLDGKFAIGNFIRDGMAGGPIVVKGDGTPYRSYLYAADLTIWLWTILLRGETCRPYNVGSEEALTIAELAHVVADSFTPSVAVQLARVTVPGQAAERYVPATRLAESELNLRQRILLPRAVQQVARWYTEFR
jgi:nucleoside-diphosphate-sugar epimerase